MVEWEGEGRRVEARLEATMALARESAVSCGVREEDLGRGRGSGRVVGMVVLIGVRRGRGGGGGDVELERVEVVLLIG